MNSPDVKFSDLELARRLSQRLSGEPEKDGEVPVVAKAGVSFVKFSASRFVGAAPVARAEPVQAAVAAPMVAPSIPELKLTEFKNWDELLAWALDLTTSKVTFVVDPEGFVISSAGKWVFEELEGLGSQLLYIMERTNRIKDAGSIRSVSIQFDSFFLTGLSFTREGMGSFILGVIDSKPMVPELITSISKQTYYNLEHL
jgi:hypothetical protein